MRLISFDVGIKNLAYCVFSISDTKWSIPEWICANLLEINDGSGASHTSTPCCHLISGKRKSDAARLCNKNAKWVAPNKTDSYCETHAKLHTEWILPKKRHTASHIKKMKLAEVELEYSNTSGANAATKTDANAATKTDAAIANTSKKMKKPEMIERILAYYESKCYRSTTENIEKSKTAGETDLVTIGRAIRRQLDADPSIQGITHIIIENQISTIAARMKTIQGMIAQYFIMRFGDAVQIEFVSSRNKLKGFSSEKEPEHSVQSTELNSEKTTKPTYKANKSDGIIICRDFFESNREMDEWLPVFEKSKKRDDLADCFLQGIWYLKFNKIISYAAKLKHKYCVCIINNGSD
jgi:hypothetical protein